MTFILQYALAAFALASQIQFLMFSTVYRFGSVKYMEHTKLDRFLRRSAYKLSMVVLTLVVALVVAVVSYFSTKTRFVRGYILKIKSL
jgi:hypothetical protein